MNNSKTWGWVIGVVVVILLGVGAYMYFAGNGGTSPSNQTNNSYSSSPSGAGTGTSGTGGSASNAAAQGQAVFSVTDAAAAIQNVNEITLTVDKLEVQSATQGWITVSNEVKQYNLLALNASGKVQVLANANLAAGKYNQVRLHVSDVVVAEKNGTIKHAKLPSGDLKIVGGFTVATGTSASITFDFMGDKSLHVTGQGDYIFAPVVKAETKDNAQVAVDANGNVSVTGGRVESNTNVGMDVDGSVKTNFVLGANANLELTNGVIRLKAAGETESAGVTVSAAQAAKIATDGGYLDTAISVQLTMSGGKKTWRVSGLKNLLPASVMIDATTGAVVTAQ